jgi:iron complex outermembrane receptor protein
MDLPLEQLMQYRVDTVYGASRYAQKTTEAPASISIVTDDEIVRLGDRTLADVLRDVRGLYVTDDRNYSYLGARGFLRPGDYNTRTLVVIDGHRMNDDIYEASYVGRENMLDVGLIKRVEVIRGPSSSVYGSNAYFGVVNIVTKRGQDVGGVETSASAGSLGTYEGSVTYGAAGKGGLDVLVSANYYASAGEGSLYFPEFDPGRTSDPAAADGGVASRSDGETAAKAFARIGGGDLTLTLFYTTRTRHVPTASFGTVFDSRLEKTDDARGYADLEYSHVYGDVRVDGHVSTDMTSYRGIYPYAYTPGTITLQKDYAYGQWADTEWLASGKFLERNTWLAGFEYRDNLRQRQYYYDDTTPRTYYLDDSRSSRAIGIYAEDQVSVRDNVLLNLGLRYDRYDPGFGGTVNPRLGLIFNPAPGTTLKALYGTAYRAPSAYEQYYYPVPGPAAPLKPETIATSELVLEQSFGSGQSASVSGYHYRTSDLITQFATPAGDVYFRNLNWANANGIEFEYEIKPGGGWLARASLALQRTKDGMTGQDLTNSPRRLAKLNLIAPLDGGRLFAGLEVQESGDAITLASTESEDFTLANLTLSTRRSSSGWAASASVYNLLDSRYGYPGDSDQLQNIIIQNGRTFRLTVDFKY